MTSNEIRQSFLDFFKSKQHTIVPSSSLMPDSPNLLFTNAGMNQFVPIFLEQQKCPYTPGRSADTQKCIRAGGKHNDLEDVGMDTYHHTFFEMLGNWSFGDYFKEEAIDWAWELITEVWKFPKERLYATIYAPDKAKGDPAERDDEAHAFWKAKFEAAGLDPAVHVVEGGKADNFWMMGETGPCGPCSELHVDLTPEGDSKGALVNKDDARCIEIWNLVFIQFNANPDKTFSELPARHVDTGMGFERVAGIIQQTRNFTEFSNIVSNYEGDVFRPLFDALEKLSGKKYASTLPVAGSTGANDQEKEDVAFRVIADHIRTLSFAIADGIHPGNTGRNYVLRRILRRAVKYGRTLGFEEPFFYKLVDVLVDSMGDVFPELRNRHAQVVKTIRTEEESFNRTLDTGLDIFQSILAGQKAWSERAQALKKEFDPVGWKVDGDKVGTTKWGQGIPRSLSEEKFLDVYPKGLASAVKTIVSSLESAELQPAVEIAMEATKVLSGDAAFKLYDTHGFPRDLTELLAREAGLTVDAARFEELMAEQKKRSQEGREQTVISVSNIDTSVPTDFVGFDDLEATTEVLALVDLDGKMGVTLSVSPCYAQMGGQLGDTGTLSDGTRRWAIVDTQKAGNTYVHMLLDAEGLSQGDRLRISVDKDRRRAIERHHTVTHLLHWALHEVVSRDASQQGSSVAPDKLTFDFNGSALTPEQLADIEKLVNERILENSGVYWGEVDHSEVQGRTDIMQFFADKYGDRVRVVQVGGKSGGLDGYSMELCGGTHVRTTGEIGLFRITGEAAIAAGIRRIEATSGLVAYDQARGDSELLRSLATRVNAPLGELEKKLEAVLQQQKDLEKQLKSSLQSQAAELARGLAARADTVGDVPYVSENLGAVGGDFLQLVADGLKSSFKGVVVLGGSKGGSVALVATVSSDFTSKIQAGRIIKTIAPIVGGKGGGRPENARGGGKDEKQLGEALAKVKELIGS